jgi:hypothetical protein
LEVLIIKLIPRGFEKEFISIVVFAESYYFNFIVPHGWPDAVHIKDLQVSVLAIDGDGLVGNFIPTHRINDGIYLGFHSFLGYTIIGSYLHLEGCYT